MVAQVAAFAAEHYDQPALGGVGALGAVVMVVAFTAFLWSTVGTYGDEVQA